MGPSTPDSELAATLKTFGSSIWSVVGLSAFINIFAIASSVYLMMVYDRVLSSGSTVTLFSLLILFSFIFVFHGVMDVMRSHVLVDLSRAFSARLAPRLQQLQWQAALSGSAGTARPVTEMDRIRSFVAGPRPGAFIDLPWIFLFLLVLFLMHVWLGVTTLVGIVIFAALTLYTERKVAANMGGIELLRLHRNKLLERNNLNAPTIKGLGMIPPVVREWRAAEHAY